MSRTWWAWARLLGGAGLAAVVLWRLGAGPFLDGIRTMSGRPLVAGVGIAVLTTACCAWRWTIVARGLGVQLPFRTAFTAYYRSQFLNSTLPGGVLGDVHRAVRHGSDVGDLGGGLRAVAWERSAGQLVQVGLTLSVLLSLPSPVNSAMPIVAVIAMAVAVVAVLVSRAVPRGRRSRLDRAVRRVADDLQGGLLARRAWPGILLASTVVVAGHVATFLIAARVVGSTASTVRLLPLALLVLLATGIPTNVGGWGPREGMAAWAFGVAGLGGAQGVATAVVYGVMALVASLPGAAVLIVAWYRRDTRDPEPAAPPRWLSAIASSREGAARG